VIGAHVTYGEEGDVILASQKGQFIRMELSKIKRLGRDTQGVTLMKLHEGDKVSSVALILPEKDEQPELGIDTEDSVEKKIEISKKTDERKTPKVEKKIDEKLEEKEEKQTAQKSKIVKTPTINTAERLKINDYQKQELDDGKGEDSVIQIHTYDDNVNILDDENLSEKSKNDETSDGETNYWGKELN
jgi:DNA gyrase/topoisomerase IV subunit A